MNGGNKDWYLCARRGDGRVALGGLGHALREGVEGGGRAEWRERERGGDSLRSERKASTRCGRGGMGCIGPLPRPRVIEGQVGGPCPRSEKKDDSDSPPKL